MRVLSQSSDGDLKLKRVNAEIVQGRGFETIHTLEEMVAEFECQPVACKRSYRMVVVHKRLGHDRGQLRLSEEYRYLFLYHQRPHDPGGPDRVQGQRPL